MKYLILLLLLGGCSVDQKGWKLIRCSPASGCNSEYIFPTKETCNEVATELRVYGGAYACMESK